MNNLETLDDVFSKIKFEAIQVQDSFEEKAKSLKQKIMDKFIFGYSYENIKDKTKELFPFFNDPNWIQDYFSAIEVTNEVNEYVVTINSKVLSDKELPINLPELLEFGNPMLGIPQVLHLRISLDDF